MNKYFKSLVTGLAIKAAILGVFFLDGKEEKGTGSTFHRKQDVQLYVLLEPLHIHQTAQPGKHLGFVPFHGFVRVQLPVAFGAPKQGNRFALVGGALPKTVQAKLDRSLNFKGIIIAKVCKGLDVV